MFFRGCRQRVSPIDNALEPPENSPKKAFLEVKFLA
jgi:hypothetical protein